LHADECSAAPKTRGCATVDVCHVTRYNRCMIKTFADKQTQQLYLTGAVRRFPPDIARRAVRKLDQVDAAKRVEDLRVPPGNRLHLLDGNRAGQYSISINDQWRICFRFEDGDAYDLEICDYH
jgi:proteic killer suppression protein